MSTSKLKDQRACLNIRGIFKLAKAPTPVFENVSLHLSVFTAHRILYIWKNSWNVFISAEESKLRTEVCLHHHQVTQVIKSRLYIGNTARLVLVESIYQGTRMFATSFVTKL